jgi:CheY-like chemotaxis protein
VRKILVVDDSPVARMTLKKRIEAHGLTVETKESVADCGSVDGNSYDAALLDFDLGDGTGADVAARLRRTSPDLPIAFFTASEDEPAVDALRALGPVFKKPELDRAVEWVATLRQMTP